MKYVSRADLDWPGTKSAVMTAALGVKIHYEGTHVSVKDHSECGPMWSAIRTSHMNNKTQGWVDIAYNLGVCKHGYVFEGRGVKHESGANGNQALNHAHYAVCAFLGDTGDTRPTPEMIQGIKDAIALLRANGAGKEIKGHRDGHPTSCPGEPLYALVRSAALEPDGRTDPLPPSPAPTPNHPWPGVLVQRGSSGDVVRTVQSRLKARGWKITVDGKFGSGTDSVVRAFQKDKKLEQDGVVGRKTWDALWNSPIT